MSQSSQAPSFTHWFQRVVATKLLLPAPDWSAAAAPEKSVTTYCQRLAPATVTCVGWVPTQVMSVGVPAFTLASHAMTSAKGSVVTMVYWPVPVRVTVKPVPLVLAATGCDAP